MFPLIQTIRFPASSGGPHVVLPDCMVLHWIFIHTFLFCAVCPPQQEKSNTDLLYFKGNLRFTECDDSYRWLWAFKVMINCFWWPFWSGVVTLPLLYVTRQQLLDLQTRVGCCTETNEAVTNNRTTEIQSELLSSLSTSSLVSKLQYTVYMSIRWWYSAKLFPEREDLLMILRQKQQHQGISSRSWHRSAQFFWG